MGGFFTHTLSDRPPFAEARGGAMEDDGLTSLDSLLEAGQKKWNSLRGETPDPQNRGCKQQQ